MEGLAEVGWVVAGGEVLGLVAGEVEGFEGRGGGDAGEFGLDGGCEVGRGVGDW